MSSSDKTIRDIIISSEGEVTMPLQPAFSVSPTATQDNVTGDGTSYTMLWAGTEIFDRNNDFATSIFTAPVTGLYQFNVMITFSGLTGTHTGESIQIVTSNRTYEQRFNPEGVASGGNVGISMSILADMDAADTCVVKLKISGSTKVIDINTTHQFTNFQGFLVA